MGTTAAVPGEMMSTHPLPRLSVHMIVSLSLLLCNPCYVNSLPTRLALARFSGPNPASIARRVYVGSVFSEVTQVHLKAVFESFGTVCSLPPSSRHQHQL